MTVARDDYFDLSLDTYPILDPAPLELGSEICCVGAICFLQKCPALCALALKTH